MFVFVRFLSLTVFFLRIKYVFIMVVVIVLSLKCRAIENIVSVCRPNKHIFFDCGIASRSVHIIGPLWMYGSYRPNSCRRPVLKSKR